MKRIKDKLKRLSRGGSSEKPEIEDNEVAFSYATEKDPVVKRWIIRAVEKLTGQPYLRQIYLENKHNPSDGESFWQAVIRKLELKLEFNEEQIQEIPKEGPVILISNHPFGVLDGIVMNHIAERVRDDYRILINEVLTQAEEVAHYMLPIDFSQTESALKTNINSRNQASKHVESGGLLIIFPAGGVSTKTGWFGPVTDLEWKTFIAKLIMQSHATVVPLYFWGQNSKLFQIASLISQTARLSLLFKEVYSKIGSSIRFKIGKPIPFKDIEHIKSRKELTEYLRQITYDLGHSELVPKNEN